MEKGTLILFCGLPGAGKTSQAKKMEVERKLLRLCPDEWIIPLLKDRQDISEMDRLRNPVEQLLWKEAQILLGLGVTVLLENGFWSMTERDSYRVKAKEIGASTELYYFNIPLEKLLERVSKRNNSLGDESFRIGPNELKDWNNSFEAPNEEEGRSYDVYKVISW